jgi:hypothetical protein
VLDRIGDDRSGTQVAVREGPAYFEHLCSEVERITSTHCVRAKPVRQLGCGAELAEKRGNAVMGVRDSGDPLFRTCIATALCELSLSVCVRAQSNPRTMGAGCTKGRLRRAAPSSSL